jgi:hypothetical protein
VINKLLKNQDNIEKIRDRIGIILAGEIINQYKLAKEYKPEPGEEFDSEDFNIDIFIENKRPWDIEKLPLINILIFGTKPPQDGSRAGGTHSNQYYTTIFHIDCYAKGRHIEGGDDDRDANYRAWVVARIVRSILMSAENNYFGLRDIVGKRMVTARNTIDLKDIPQAAEDIALCRIVLEVEAFEESPQGDFEIMEGMNFKISTADGKIIMAEIKTPPFKEDLNGNTSISS